MGFQQPGPKGGAAYRDKKFLRWPRAARVPANSESVRAIPAKRRQSSARESLRNRSLGENLALREPSIFAHLEGIEVTGGSKNRKSKFKKSILTTKQRKLLPVQVEPYASSLPKVLPQFLGQA